MNTRTLTQVIAELKTVKNWILTSLIVAGTLGALTIVYKIIFHFYIFMIGIK